MTNNLNKDKIEKYHSSHLVIFHYHKTTISAYFFIQMFIIIQSLSRVLIYIDESGSPYKGERLFLGSAVWCAPTSNDGVQTTLRYTIDQIRSMVGKCNKKIPKEIHYSDGLRRMATEIVNLTFQKAYEDKTIRRNDLLWKNHPLANTTSFCNPRIEWELTREDDISNRMRARMISELLQPQFTFNGKFRLDVDVVLDSECWKISVDQVAESLKRLIGENNVHIKFFCEDSKKVPGLQLADVFAGVSRHYRLERDVGEAFELINGKSIFHVGSR